MNYTATLALLLAAFRFRLADEVRPGRAPQQAPPRRAAEGRPVGRRAWRRLSRRAWRPLLRACALSQGSRTGLPARWCKHGAVSALALPGARLQGGSAARVAQ